MKKINQGCASQEGLIHLDSTCDDKLEKSREKLERLLLLSFIFHLAPKEMQGCDLYLELACCPKLEPMSYADGPGLEALSLSSTSLYVRGPVLNLTPVGRFFVDKLYTPRLILSVSYSCGPG
jgi:hypothetical protein